MIVLTPYQTLAERLPAGTSVYHREFGRGVVQGTVVLQDEECAYVLFGGGLLTTVIAATLVVTWGPR